MRTSVALGTNGKKHSLSRPTAKIKIQGQRHHFITWINGADSAVIPVLLIVSQRPINCYYESVKIRALLLVSRLTWIDHTRHQVVLPMYSQCRATRGKSLHNSIDFMAKIEQMQRGH